MLDGSFSVDFHRRLRSPLAENGGVFGRVLVVVVDDQIVWGLHISAAFLCDLEG